MVDKASGSVKKNNTRSSRYGVDETKAVNGREIPRQHKLPKGYERCGALLELMLRHLEAAARA